MWENIFYNSTSYVNSSVNYFFGGYKICVMQYSGKYTTAQKEAWYNTAKKKKINERQGGQCLLNIGWNGRRHLWSVTYMEYTYKEYTYTHTYTLCLYDKMITHDCVPVRFFSCHHLMKLVRCAYKGKRWHSEVKMTEALNSCEIMVRALGKVGVGGKRKSRKTGSTNEIAVMVF